VVSVEVTIVVIEKTPHVSKLASETLIVRPVLLEKASVVLAIIACRLGFCTLYASPGKKGLSVSQSWAPSLREEVVIFALKVAFHFNFVLQRWLVKVESCVFHQACPRASRSNSRAEDGFVNVF
jgi:hypothetical protein